MNLCSEHHEEVCFEGRVCPVCEARKEVDQLEREIERLNKEILGLEQELMDWENA